MVSLRRITRYYRRLITAVLLMVLITLIIIKGHNFNIDRIYRKSAKFIEKSVKNRRLFR